MKTKIIFSLGIFILLIGIVSAVNINIDMKNSFGIGDEVSFNYTLISEVSLTGQYIVSVSCPKAPVPLLEIKDFSLQMNQPLTQNYVYLSKISENIEPQICNAFVSIISPIEVSSNKSFSITTNPSFNFQVLTCKEQTCHNQTKVFIKGENIYLDSKSDIPSLIIIANLTYPDGKTKILNLPTFIKAEQVGTYSLNIQASKDKYQTITKEIQFGVIEKEANIEYTNLAEEKQNLSAKIPDYIFIIAGIVLVLGMIVLIIYILKKNMRAKSN